MKRILNFILLLMLLIIPNTVLAAGSTSASAPSTVEVGKNATFTVKISGVAAWNLKLVGSGATSGCSANFADVTADGGNTSKSFTVTCKANSVGTITFIASGDITSSDGSNSNVSITKSVNIVKEREKDTEARLSSLSVSGYKINFDKDKTTYSINVEPTTSSITISAKAMSGTAKITGTGKRTIDAGGGKFNIICTAENGTKKTYTINVSVIDSNPINVNVGSNKYTVVKSSKLLVAPSNSVESTIKVNDIEVPAFIVEKAKLTIVGLKDNDGNIKYAIYNKDSYKLYNENKSDQLILYIKNIPNGKEGFQKTTIKINNETYEALESEDKSIVLIYAMNIVTGKENYYLYDKEENSYVIYNDKMLLTVKEELLKYKNVILYMAGGLIFLLLLLMIVLLKKSKKKKVIITEPLPPVKEEKVENKVKKNKPKKEEPSEIKKDTTDKKTTKANSQNKDDVLAKVNDATSIIENYEKSIKNTQKEIAKKKEEVEETEMYDIFEDDKKKKRKKK